MEDPFKGYLLLVLFGVPIAFGILGGLGGWLGSKIKVRSKPGRGLLGAYQVLSLIGIPFLLILFQQVPVPVEALAFAVWIFTLSLSAQALQRSERTGACG